MSTVQEHVPQPEASKDRTEQPSARRVVKAAFEKITSLDVFKRHQAALFDKLNEAATQATTRAAEKLAHFIATTQLSEAGVANAEQRTGVKEKLAAHQARIQEAFTRVKDGISQASEQNFEALKSKEKVIEDAQEKRADVLRKTLSGAADLIPFAGGAKMAMEAVHGADAAGETLTGKDRVIHGVMGVASLALDFTGIGEAGKAIGLVGRSAELVGKLGVQLAEKGAAKSAALLAKTATFMGKHPTVVAQAEKWAEQKIGAKVKDIANYRKGDRPAAQPEQVAA